MSASQNTTLKHFPIRNFVVTVNYTIIYWTTESAFVLGVVLSLVSVTRPFELLVEGGGEREAMRYGHILGRLHTSNYHGSTNFSCKKTHHYDNHITVVVAMRHAFVRFETDANMFVPNGVSEQDSRCKVSGFVVVVHAQNRTAFTLVQTNQRKKEKKKEK